MQAAMTVASNRLTLPASWQLCPRPKLVNEQRSLAVCNPLFGLAGSLTCRCARVPRPVASDSTPTSAANCDCAGRELALVPAQNLLASQVIELDQLQRSADGDAGVVHQPIDAIIAHRLIDVLGGCSYGGLVGYVEDQWCEAIGYLAPQRIAVGLTTNTGKDAKAKSVQMERTRLPDAGGCAGDHNGSGVLWSHDRGSRDCVMFSAASGMPCYCRLAVTCTQSASSV